MTWTDVGIVATTAATGWLIIKELYKTFVVDRKKDKAALEVAKAEQPEIMRQLELGNFKAAAEGISIAQTFVNQQLAIAQAELARLRERDTALEAEAQGWENKYRERDDKVSELERRCATMEGKYEALSEQLKNCQQLIATRGQK